MFNKKRLDNFFYPGILVAAILAFVLVGFNANGVLSMENVEQERIEAKEREEARKAAEEGTDADTEASDDGDW